MLNAAAIPQPLTRAEYDRMVAGGAFADERIELLRGEIVPMSPQGPMHADVVTRLVERLLVELQGRARVRSQCPLAASGDSEPEPDIAVVPPGRYATEHPTTARLIIEVADSSLPVDREIKAALYAQCGVPEYWIINLLDRIIEVYAHPENGMYRTATTRVRGNILSLVAFPDVRIAVDDIV